MVQHALKKMELSCDIWLSNSKNSGSNFKFRGSVARAWHKKK